MCVLDLCGPILSRTRPLSFSLSNHAATNGIENNFGGAVEIQLGPSQLKTRHAMRPGLAVGHRLFMKSE